MLKIVCPPKQNTKSEKQNTITFQSKTHTLAEALMQNFFRKIHKKDKHTLLQAWKHSKVTKDLNWLKTLKHEKHSRATKKIANIC